MLHKDSRLALDFKVLCRADGQLVLVASHVKRPAAIHDGNALLGRVALDPNTLTPSTLAALGLQGYAELAGPDVTAVRVALDHSGLVDGG